MSHQSIIDILIQAGVWPPELEPEAMPVVGKVYNVFPGQLLHEKDWSYFPDKKYEVIAKKYIADGCVCLFPPFSSFFYLAKEEAGKSKIIEVNTEKGVPAVPIFKKIVDLCKNFDYVCLVGSAEYIRYIRNHWGNPKISSITTQAFFLTQPMIQEEERMKREERMTNKNRITKNSPEAVCAMAGLNTNIVIANQQFLVVKYC